MQDSNKRDSVKLENTWNLDTLYKDLQSWEKDFEELSSSITNLSKYQGKLAKSSENLKNTIIEFYKLFRKAEKLYTYAHLLSDQDLSNQDNINLKERAMSLYAQISQESSFIRPELLSIPEETLDFSSFKDYERAVKEIIRYKPHTLSSKEENLLAMGTEYFSSTSSIFSQLNNTELNFENIDDETPLTHGSYAVLLREQDREVRKKAFENYYEEFNQHKNTLSSIYASSVKKNVFLARARNHNSALESSLFNDNVEKDVYLSLIESVRSNLNHLHDYYDFRSEKLGIKPLKIYDTYIPIVNEVEVKYSYEKACENINNALSVLGSEYQSILADGLQKSRWVDKYENQDKRSGAYCSGSYDSNPFILMNYKDAGFDGMFTLAHEAGHAMHSYFSNKAQTYQDHQYTIFVAEVASTVNELLLLNYLQKENKGDKVMQSVLSNHLLDDIKSTYYRQTMFAEFELKAHEQAENGLPLSLDFFRNTYQELLESYFGKSVEIGDLDSLEFARIPHFYSAFYVYKYATGISAAIDISRRILSGDKKSLESYLNFLKSGCSKHPIELLKDAGVDLTKKESLDESSKVFKEELNNLVNLLT